MFPGKIRRKTFPKKIAKKKFQNKIAENRFSKQLGKKYDFSQKQNLKKYIFPGKNRKKLSFPKKKYQTYIFSNKIDFSKLKSQTK